VSIIVEELFTMQKEWPRNFSVSKVIFSGVSIENSNIFLEIIYGKF
jgi:hypothetical protein